MFSFSTVPEILNVTDTCTRFLQRLQMQMKEVNPKIVENFSQAIVGKEFEIIYQQMMNNAVHATDANTVMKTKDRNTVNSFQ